MFYFILGLFTGSIIGVISICRVQFNRKEKKENE